MPVPSALTYADEPTKQGESYRLFTRPRLTEHGPEQRRPARTRPESRGALPEGARDEKLLAFSCKKRGFCPSCGARRMADSAALLVDDILPHQPIRQWVLSVPFPLRFLFGAPGMALFWSLWW